MEGDKNTVFRVLNELTTKTLDDQRYDHLNFVKFHLIKNTNVKEVIGKVNKSLSVAATRDRGFELLSELIEFLPVEIVAENAVFWTNIALGQHSKGVVKPLRLGVIGRLIDLCSNIPEFKKVVVADYLSEIVQACLKGENNVLPQHSLACLTICLLRFSSSCLPFKNNVETTLAKCLEYQGEDLIFVKKAAIAFLYVNQIGGAGADGINHQNNWTKQLEKLCATTQELLSELNSETSDFERSVAKKLRNCMIFLKIMLQKSFPVPKIIPLETILDVISKALDNHECFSGVLLAKAESLSVLARIQVEFLYLLRSLIACTQQRLTPFSLTINKMLLNYLRRIHSCDCFKSNRIYSVAAYTVIRFWIKTARNSFHCSFHEKLIRFIIDDASAVEQKVTLQLNNSKKKKNNAPSCIKTTSVTLDSRDLLGVKKNREEACVQALETLEVFLKSAYLKINSKLTEELYATLTKTLINIQGGKTAPPYTNKKCQLLLYRAIITLFEQPYLPIPPPLSFTIHLLNTGHNSRDTDIAAICENGLNKLELLCQPVCPTLYVGSEKVVSENDEEEEEVVEEKMSVEEHQEELKEKVVEEEMEKIHIISDIVIKPPENGKIAYEEATTDVVEVLINVTEDGDVAEKTAYDSSDVCVIEEDSTDEEVIVQQNGGTNENLPIQQNGHTVNEVIEIFDEPPVKKIKTDFEENSNESMLDSFVNIVNDY